MPPSQATVGNVASLPMQTIWKPHVTVAAVIQQDGLFLLVEEETDEGLRLNQPAGHLEEGESLIQAVIRETREETRYDFEPRALIGIYQWQHPKKGMTYLRFAFAGEITGHDPARALDTGILAPRWMSPAEIDASTDRHRSPLICQCVRDCLSGQRYPLDLIHHTI